jgi:hypothetical protein
LKFVKRERNIEGEETGYSGYYSMLKNPAGLIFIFFFGVLGMIVSEGNEGQVMGAGLFYVTGFLIAFSGRLMDETKKKELEFTKNQKIRASKMSHVILVLFPLYITLIGALGFDILDWRLWVITSCGTALLIAMGRVYTRQSGGYSDPILNQARISVVLMFIMTVISFVVFDLDVFDWKLWLLVLVVGALFPRIGYWITRGRWFPKGA